MVYIYVKKNGLEKYYYLRIDKRINGKKVVKDIAYLGNDLSKININNLLDNKVYHKEIRKSYRTITKFLNSNYYIQKAESLKLKKNNYLTTEEQVKLESIKLHFDSRFKTLDLQTQRDIYNHFIVSFTYNTTSIEGNTIPLSGVRKILNEDNATLKNKTLREIYDLRNTKNTFFSILNKTEFNLELIVDVHKQLMTDIDDRTEFRNFDIRVTKSHFDSTPYFRIYKEMDELFDWYNKSKEHPFVKAVIFHHKFERIHPFADGNGRTGRTLFNFMLLKFNYPPIVITKKNRDKYLDTLSIADKKEDYKPLIGFLISEYETSYWENFIV